MKAGERDPAGGVSSQGSSLHLAALAGLAVSAPLLVEVVRGARRLGWYGAGGWKPGLLLLAVGWMLPAAVAGGITYLARRSGRHRPRVVLGGVAALTALGSLQLLNRLAVLEATAVPLLAAGSSAGAVLAYRRWPRARFVLAALLPVVVLLPLLVWSAAVIESAGTSGPERSGSPSLLMVVYSDLPVNALLDSEGAVDPVRFPYLASLAGRSRWFTDATTPHAGAEEALQALVTGEPLPAPLPAAPWAEDAPPSLFTLLGAAWEVRAWGDGGLCPPAVNLRRGGRTTSPARSLWRLAAGLGAEYLEGLLPGALGQALPSGEEVWDRAVQEEGWGQEVGLRGRATVDEVLASFGARDGPRFDFVRLPWPGLPWSTLPSGREYADPWQVPGYGERWTSDPWPVTLAYQRLLLELAAADAQTGRILERLRELERLERTVVVVTADRGMSFEPGSYPWGDPDGTLEGEVLPVPLLIRLPGEQRGRVDRRPVTTLDVVPTVAAALGVEVPWPLVGHPLVGTVASERRRIRRAWVEVVEGSGHYREVAVPPAAGGEDRRLAWKLSVFGEGAESSRGLFRFGPHRDLVGRQRAELEVGEATEIGASLLAPAGSLVVDLSREPVPARVVGRLALPPGAPRVVDLALVVDGTVEATTRSYPLPAGQAGFSVVLPEAVLQEGGHQLEVLVIGEGRTGMSQLWSASGDRRQELLRRTFEGGQRIWRRDGEVGFGGVELLAREPGMELIEQPGAGLKVVGKGQQPALLLPAFEPPAGSPVIVALSVWTPIPVPLRLYYPTRDEPRYWWTRSYRQPLPPGESIVYVQIDDTGLSGRLRLDLGGSSVAYLLRSVEVRALTDPVARVNPAPAPRGGR